MESVLEINQLSKNYGRICALDNLTLKIEKGNVYGLLGPNGSGKTTTLAIILGILKMDSGSFTWFENQYGDNPRRKIGSILETPNFYPYLNAVDNLDIVRQIKKTPKQDYDEILEVVDLAHRKSSPFSTYSLGMKQRLAIASTMIGAPEVLIFDEPTNGLDPAGISEVRSILKRIADQGKTVIMASHILDEVEKICSHVAIIKKGKLLATGPIGGILGDDIQLEIGANDMEKLKTELNSMPYIVVNKENKEFYDCSMTNDLAVTDVSRKLSDRGLIITHFVARKRKLEEEFLTITKN
jgi:ABC-2 type transport system ATP-binding protein